MGQNKGKQFNLSKRDLLSKMLQKRKPTSREIGELLGMSPTSVSREVMRNRITSKPKELQGLCSRCEFLFSCKLKHICGRRECSQNCVRCKAIVSCLHYEEFTCNVAKRWPLCCNGCQKETRCPLTHYYYHPDDAENKARGRLVESREGADLNDDEYKAMDEVLFDAIVSKKQSVHHALKANPEVIKCSEKTVYRLISKGIFRTKNIDLPREPGLKKRVRKKLADHYAYKHQGVIDRTGHLWSDWLVYRIRHSITSYFQMDFLGKPNASSKEVLALTMPGISFTLLYLLEDSSSKKVAALFDLIEQEIGVSLFKTIFPALLTDRDTVFDDYSRIEADSNGEVRTAVFFCDPGASNQKPNVENYNSQLRVPFPKKAILNEYSQDELYEVASNMNSRMLNSIDDKTPYDLFSSVYGEEATRKLHIRKIPAKEVTLMPIHK